MSDGHFTNSRREVGRAASGASELLDGSLRAFRRSFLFFGQQTDRIDLRLARSHLLQFANQPLQFRRAGIVFSIANQQ